MTIVTRWRILTPSLLSVVRIVAAFLFIQFGTAKLFAFPASIMPDGSTVPLASQTGIAAALETFGGLLLLLALYFFCRRRALEPGCRLAWNGTVRRG
jgi:putative oxidoreductase